MQGKLASTALLLVTSLFGQTRVLNNGPIAPPNAAPYGNILFPGGTPIAPPAPRLGSLIPNRGQYQGGYVSPPAGSNNRPGGRERTVVVPYAFPVYFSDNGGYNNYPQAPPVTVVVPQQQQTVPTVIINQTFTGQNLEPDPEAANPSSVRVYKTPVRPQTPEPARAPRDRAAEDRATIYLIAYKDSTIHSAIGYWTEDGTLHYVTQEGKVNRITLDQVDRVLSEQLNSERNVEFQIKTK